MVRRKYLLGFPFPFINITISQPSRSELLKESKSYYEDLRDEIDKEMTDIDKEIRKLASNIDKDIGNIVSKAKLGD